VVPAKREIDSAPIVGIDERIVPDLVALVDIGHAWRGELAQRLRKAVQIAEPRHVPGQLFDLVGECVAFAPLQRELDELPEHLIVIGAGYVSLEFGQMFRRFGSKVTILEHSERFFSREDEDVSGEIKKFLEEEGIEIFTGCFAKKVSSNSKEISVHAIIDKIKSFKEEAQKTGLLEKLQQAEQFKTNNMQQWLQEPDKLKTLAKDQLDLNGLQKLFLNMNRLQIGMNNINLSPLTLYQYTNNGVNAEFLNNNKLYLIV